MKFVTLAFSLILFTSTDSPEPNMIQEEDSLSHILTKYKRVFQELSIFDEDLRKTLIKEEIDLVENLENEEVEYPEEKIEEYREIEVVATAYTAYCKGCTGITKTGLDIRKNPHLKLIAVDPSVIPLGSKIWVEGYGEATAEDIGGDIKGNRIDVFIPKTDDALEWGRQRIKIKVYN